MMDLLDLVKQACIDEELDSSSAALIKESCSYYHYCCDETDDKNWGCGYRSLQSLCSWVVRRTATPTTVPGIREIQEVLVTVGDKPRSHVGSHDWIGTYEACIVMDHLYGAPCKLIHVPRDASVLDHIPSLLTHFTDTGSPVMIGGDVDGASKTLLGVSANPPLFLIADPHYLGPPDETKIIADGYVNWHSPELFQTSSFYNFCLPQSIVNNYVSK